MELLRSSLPPMPLIMHGNDGGNIKKLSKPPPESIVKKAAEAFAPRYDEWMQSHHVLARRIIDAYEEQGQIGRVVAEVGCGTAILTIELMLKRMEAVFKDLVSGCSMQPATYICLDFSPVMLELARRNIAQSLATATADAGTVEPAARRRRLEKGDFEISGSGTPRISLIYKGEGGNERRTVLEAIFSCADATKLNEAGGGRIDTTILSYVMHWFRGYQGKLDVLTALSQELAPGGTIVSIEEYPLVVRADLHPDDRDVQELACLIQGATTVIPPAHMKALYTMAGFQPARGAVMDVRIDEYHVMYGAAYKKATAD